MMFTTMRILRPLSVSSSRSASPKVATNAAACCRGEDTSPCRMSLTDLCEGDRVFDLPTQIHFAPITRTSTEQKAGHDSTVIQPDIAEMAITASRTSATLSFAVSVRDHHPCFCLAPRVRMAFVNEGLPLFTGRNAASQVAEQTN